MKRRNVAIVGLVVVAVAAVVVWWFTRAGSPSPPPKVAEPDPWAGEDTSALIAKKRASRGDRPVDQRPASLAGVVRRKADGSGVAGAVVTVEPREFGGAIVASTRTDEPIDVVTDAAGAWAVPALKPGAYVVSAAAAELLPASLDVDVAPGAARGDLVLALDAGGALVTGVVQDIGGGSIAGARITVRPAGLAALDSASSYAAVTGADGRYRLSLPDGGWGATASQADYTDDTASFQVRGRPVTVDFTLTPGATVRGVVIARDTGQPVAGARVTAGGGRGGRGREVGARGAATSDEHGAFVLRGAGSGALSLSASGRGYASKEPTVIEVGIGEEVTGVRVMVDRAFDVSGFVVRKGGDGEGVAGVRVGIFSFGEGDAGFAEQPSADDGYFEILGVKPGRYLVAALGEGVMPEIGQPVHVLDRDVDDVLVNVDAGATLSGRVTPPAVARLSLELDLSKVGLGNMFEVAKSALVHGTSAPSGEFTLRAVPPGTFTLRAQAADGRVGKLQVTVTAADQGGLVVPLEARGAISGRVVDVTGGAVAGVTVKASGDSKTMTIDLGEGPTSAVTAEDGSFRVAGLDAGQVRLRVSDEDGPLAWAEGNDDDEHAVTVEDGKEVRGVVLKVEARDGVIRGVVLGTDRQPVADAWVTARPTSSPWSAEVSRMRARAEAARDAGPDDGGGSGSVTVTVTTDDDGSGDDDDDDGAWGRGRTVLTGEDGRFTIDRLRRGAYFVSAEATKGGLRGQKPGVSTGQSVTLVLEPLAALTVTVTASGAPVASYELRCGGAGETVRRAVQAADGTVRLERLPPGRYRCTAKADTGTATGTAELIGETRLALALGAWGSITGVVVDEAGQPRAGLRVLAHGEGQDMGSGMEDVLTGGGIKTDAAGRFEVGKLAAGEITLVVFDDAGGFAPLVQKQVTLAIGQRLDVGTLTTSAAGDGPPTDGGP